jgi:hypothetical protein
MKKLTAAQKAEKYERLVKKRKAYYLAHAEERRAYARKRYHEMMAELRATRGTK